MHLKKCVHHFRKYEAATLGTVSRIQFKHVSYFGRWSVNSDPPDKYYELTDDSSIYVAVVVLHPRMKWSFVDKFWNDRPDWRDKARRDVRQLWEAEYKHRVIPIPQERLPERRRIVVASGLSDFLDNLTCPVV